MTNTKQICVELFLEWEVTSLKHASHVSLNRQQSNANKDIDAKKEKQKQNKTEKINCTRWDDQSVPSKLMLSILYHSY